MSHKHKTAIQITIILLVAILMSNCGTAAPAQSSTPTSIRTTSTVKSAQVSSTTAPTRMVPTSTHLPSLTKTVIPPLATVPQASVLKLIPIVLMAEPPSGGWTAYSMYFAIENQSDQWAESKLDLGAGTVETEEKFTYKIDEVHIPPRAGEVIPPRFRVISLYDGFGCLFFKFKAAEKMHPVRAVFTTYGAIDLNTVPLVSPPNRYPDYLLSEPIKKMSFPTSRPKTDFKDMEQTLEIPNKAKITLKKAQVVDSARTQGELRINFDLQNLNQGYDTTVNLRCYIFDGVGLISSGGSESFRVGPGQTTQNTFQFTNVWEAYDPASKTFDSEKLKVLFNNAKLVCRGDLQAIFNLSVQ